jgi:hydroxymethylpyrimidine pyrophosphatase-like HAD family hydrolase
VDGTLTKLSRFIIPSELSRTLANIPPNIPRALCTGRPLQHITTQLEHICSHAPDPAAEHARWWIFAENGGIGYRWNPRKKEYTPFYEIPWPSEKASQDALEAFIKDRLGWMVTVRLRPNSMVIRYPNWVYFFPRFTRAVSRHTYKRIHRLLQDMKLEHDFSVQDSGIGNILIPKESGKGHAMIRWTKELGIPLHDLLVVGDQPRPGENDEDFLSGQHGTSFSVGSLTQNLYPLPVLDHRARPLHGPQGTAALLRRVEWGKE